MTRHGLAALLLAASGLTGVARADEGMWTLDNLPKQAMQREYGFTPDAQWIDHVMHASLRMASGCSASFVSPNGLVMTNHHCVASCLGDLQTGKQNLVRDGFAAPRAGAEPRCPGMELDQLQQITDVTSRIDDATRNTSGAAFIAAEHAAESAIEKECGSGDPKNTRCDVIALYHGGRYDLYKYRRYDDVRLAFAPDEAIANFGGDPDNFNYPRYDLDVSFVRAYVDNHPVHADYFPCDPTGPKAGELVFTSGNPGSTSRNETADQLELSHDVELPLTYGFYESLDGAMSQFATETPQRAKEAENTVYFTENGLKVFTGWLTAFGDPALIARRRADDQALLDWINADPSRKQAYGDPFAVIKATLAPERALFPRYAMLESRGGALGIDSDSFVIARALVRAAAERTKPDADRLPAFRDANLPALEAELFSSRPIYPDLERAKLAFSLTKLRQVLGADDAAVHLVLGRSSPDELAQRLVSGTRLADLSVRHRLWDGGAGAVAASTDPMIRFAAAVDPASRAVLKQWQDQVVAPQRQQTELIAKARFARDGNALYPDATFTERLSYGKVDGWTADGRTIPPFTNLAGLYDRATGAEPFKLTKAWVDARPHLDLGTRFDFVSTNDITGGNSGSPMIDQKAHVIGVAFDGNQASIAGDFIYDPSQNRTVGVDAASMIAALRGVYRLEWLADELVGKAGTIPGE